MSHSTPYFVDVEVDQNINGGGTDTGRAVMFSLVLYLIVNLTVT